MEKEKLKKQIKIRLGLFILLLVLSGITAFPIQWELNQVYDFMKDFPANNELSLWYFKIHEAVSQTNKQYAFLAYGTDWLAFAHIVIAVAFIGPYRDPVRNIWVIDFGIIACLMIFPLAFICGSIRGIPFFWQLIDCSFGFFGFIMLLWIRKGIVKLHKMIA